MALRIKYTVDRIAPNNITIWNGSILQQQQKMKRKKIFLALLASRANHIHTIDTLYYTNEQQPVGLFPSLVLFYPEFSDLKKIQHSEQIYS